MHIYTVSLLLYGTACRKKEKRRGRFYRLESFLFSSLSPVKFHSNFHHQGVFFFPYFISTETNLCGSCGLRGKRGKQPLLYA